MPIGHQQALEIDKLKTPRVPLLRSGMSPATNHMHLADCPPECRGCIWASLLRQQQLPDHGLWHHRQSRLAAFGSTSSCCPLLVTTPGCRLACCCCLATSLALGCCSVCCTAICCRLWCCFSSESRDAGARQQALRPGNSWQGHGEGWQLVDEGAADVPELPAAAEQLLPGCGSSTC